MSLPPNRVDYSPIIDRPRLTWPNNARVAFWVAPNIEHYEYLPDYDGVRNPWPRVPYPDVQQYTYRDYGNRVGLWRMIEVLDAYNNPLLCVPESGRAGALSGNCRGDGPAQLGFYESWNL